MSNSAKVPPMKVLRSICLVLGLVAVVPTWAASWEEATPIPAGGRANPFGFSAELLAQKVEKGRLHAVKYPLTVSGLVAPYEPFRRFVEEPSTSPMRRWLQDRFKGIFSFRSLNEIFSWIGMHPYPAVGDRDVYRIPYPENTRPEYPMGVSFITRNDAKGFTVSCSECHSGRLFGKTVLGLTNRFPRANTIFAYSKKLTHFVGPHLFQAVTGATDAETAMYKAAGKTLRAVGYHIPIQLGLDTSLAQIKLSLDRRTPDAWATKSKAYERQPQYDAYFAHHVADSKPVVWWNVKYKNRTLSDGAVLSGNPVVTAILWNEIGRGTDLKLFSHWMDENRETIEELTAAVFATEAPHITDFIPAERFDLEVVKQGQKIFQERCARCHGTYEKTWDQAGAEHLPLVEQLKTSLVRYPEQTPVIDVGTDPARYLGMKSLERLNDLEFSQRSGIVIKAQQGYVVPPLVGIWARWPYFHNNAAPSLCAVLTAGRQRPQEYWAGAAEDVNRDYDFDCNGYPSGEKVPAAWQQQDKEYLYRAEGEGRSRLGHDERIFLRNGQELLTPADKLALVKFLQTL